MVNSNPSVKLNLGCGERKKEGYINVDWKSELDPEVVHDLNTIPYPFSNGSIDLVEADHILEHLDRPFFIMQELHRILKRGGVLKIKVPHFSRGFTHAEHIHGFDVTFPLYFNKDFAKEAFESAGRSEFRLDKMRLRWHAFPHLLKRAGYGRLTAVVLTVLNRIFSFFANLSPGLCSRIWCFWVGGFEEIEFNFTCIK